MIDSNSVQPESLMAMIDGGSASRVALVAPESARMLTYDQLGEYVGDLAGRLTRLGARRGDSIALSLYNSPDFVQLLLAITTVGAAAAPLNPAYTEAEFTFYLEDIAPRFLLIQGDQPAAVLAANSTNTQVIEVSPRDDGPASLSVNGTEISETAPFEYGGAEDLAIVLHTSGTTSRPKQVPLLQRNLMASTRTLAAHYGLVSEDVSFCAMPLFHVHGLVASTFATLSTGGTVVVPRRFTPQRFWPQAREQGVTWLSAAPTLHQMILDKFDDAGSPASLRFVRSCSSALSPALMARAEAIYETPMLEAYGMTEASHQMASNPLPPARREPGSVGISTGVEIGIVDAQLRFLEQGSTGEVVIRGPGVTAGYTNNPVANAEAFFGEGWFRTGDRGSLREGYLRLEGRLKEMILRGGENISPAEIEDVLLTHPSVREAVCFGVPDDKYGEVTSAAVTVSAEADERELIDFCRQWLAAFKVPATIHILEEIPRTATGKVQRRRVAEFIATSKGD